MRRVTKRFLDYLKSEKNFSQATVKAYKADLQKFVQFVQKRNGRYVLPGDVTREMIREFLSFLGNTGFKGKNCASSRGRKLSTIRSFSRFAYQERLVRDNPTSEISIPQSREKEPAFLSEEEYRRLLKATLNVGLDKSQEPSNYGEVSSYSGYRAGEGCEQDSSFITA